MEKLVIKSIRKSYGSIEAVKGVDLIVKDREFIVFVGPSGCGKSTLLRMIAGLEDISCGDLLIDGERINDVPPDQRGLAMVFQSYALYPHMTVEENMGFSLRLSGVAKPERAAKVRKAADILQLTPLLERSPRNLSGGQRQRVAIGRAIVRDPKVFLFDEPLSNLDASLRVQTRIELIKLHRTLDATTIYVTHDQVEAMTMADRIVVLNEGQIEQVGTPLELYNSPGNMFVAGFLGSPKMNFIQCEVIGVKSDAIQLQGVVGNERLSVHGWSGLSLASKVFVGFRPDAGFLSDTGVIKGTIEAVEHLGDAVHAHIVSAGGHKVVVKIQTKAVPELGAKVTVAVASEHIFLFDDNGVSIPRHAAFAQSEL